LFFSNMMATNFSDQSLHWWIDNRLNITTLQQFADLLFIPVNNNGDHWILSFIDFQHCTYGYYYDSLVQSHSRPHICEAWSITTPATSNP
jgi:Ulp1 family protease